MQVIYKLKISEHRSLKSEAPYKTICVNPVFYKWENRTRKAEKVLNWLPITQFMGLPGPNAGLPVPRPEFLLIIPWQVSVSRTLEFRELDFNLLYYGVA